VSQFVGNLGRISPFWGNFPLEFGVLKIPKTPNASNCYFSWAFWKLLTVILPVATRAREQQQN